ncbi:MAG TPA: type II secretion system protein GspG [Thermoanaerobaculia bacterium]|nr:type II secretion system protein GspG [Thermoanaerobaculia bacterium]
MRKLAAALLLLAIPLFAAEPSRRQKIERLLSLSHALELEQAALDAAILALESSATTPEQKEELQQLRWRAKTRNTREVWIAALQRELDDKALAEVLAMYESPAREHAARAVQAGLLDAMHERLENRPLTASERDLQATRRTVADMRMLATALEARATDTNAYPESCDLETLRRLLESTYIQHMPMRDGWGHAYLYVGSPHRSEYRIVSAGADGIFEANSRILADTPLKETAGYAGDLIYQNGAFIQVPRAILGKKQ